MSDEFYIVDDMSIFDKCTINGRISKKLCEKIILPEIEKLQKENLDLRALVNIARNNFVEQDYGTDIEKAWLGKAEKYKQGSEG